MQSSVHLLCFDKEAHQDNQIEVDCMLENNKLLLTYHIQDHLNNIKWPHFEGMQEADDLWQTTCLECFLLLEDGKSYIELNFSPKGYWHIYYFDEYRKISSTMHNLVQINHIEVSKNKNQYKLIVNIDLNYDSVRSMGLSAVLENKDKILSYWALQHHSSNPDFHQSSSFSMQVNQKI